MPVSRVIDQSEVFEIAGAPSWQATDGAGVVHAIDPRLLKEAMPFDDVAHATMIGTVRPGPNGKTFYPTKVSMISKPRRA
jgi:hypothetical protein